MKLRELKDKKILNLSMAKIKVLRGAKVLNFRATRGNKVLSEARVLILGFGREGRDAFLFLRRLFPEKKLGIADQKNLKFQISNLKNIETYFDENYLSAIKNYDVVIKSPGIPFKIIPNPQLKKIITQTDIFFANCPGKIIGITGTKGKSTTSSLIYAILKAGGVKAKLVGNIGKPVLSFLVNAKASDVFVYELSSHQLYNLKTSPHIAVFLNLFREHLDYYKNFQEYARAKANIALHQTKNDYLIFNAGDKTVSRLVKQSKARKIPIKGEYYELDRNASRAVAKIFNIPEKTVEKAIVKFKPLKHRLELVGTFRGITFYNDALATIPEATMAAIDFLGDKVETVMLGGFDRKTDFKKLAKKIIASKIKTVILFPTTGEKIWRDIEKLDDESAIRHFFIDNKSGAQRAMESAIRLAYQHTNKEKICLLSTASSSFSIFKDYKEKGGLFKKYVKEYAVI